MAAEKAKQAAATVSEKVGRGDGTGGTHAASPTTTSEAGGTTLPPSGTSGPPLS